MTCINAKLIDFSSICLDPIRAIVQINISLIYTNYMLFFGILNNKLQIFHVFKGLLQQLIIWKCSEVSDSAEWKTIALHPLYDPTIWCSKVFTPSLVAISNVISWIVLVVTCSIPLCRYKKYSDFSLSNFTITCTFPPPAKLFCSLEEILHFLSCSWLWPNCSSRNFELYLLMQFN